MVAVAALAVAVLRCGPAAPAGSAGPTAGASVRPVVREVLAAGDPRAAPDQRLELVRYTIQPGTRLALHRHPGMQLAMIESGILTYTVTAGEVTIHQADGGSRVVRSGDTARIVAGEWIAESEAVVHFGANEGPDVVVILASSLLEADESPAIPMPSASG